MGSAATAARVHGHVTTTTKPPDGAAGQAGFIRRLAGKHVPLPEVLVDGTAGPPRLDHPSLNTRASWATPRTTSPFRFIRAQPRVEAQAEQAVGSTVTGHPWRQKKPHARAADSQVAHLARASDRTRRVPGLGGLRLTRASDDPAQALDLLDCSGPTRAREEKSVSGVLAGVEETAYPRAGGEVRRQQCRPRGGAAHPHAEEGGRRRSCRRRGD